MRLLSAVICVIHLLATQAALTYVGTTSWSARYGHAAVMLGQDMYVVGGTTADTVLQDAWLSTTPPYNTGTQVNAAIEMGPRAFGGMIAQLSGESYAMLYLGGYDGTESVGGVWLSYVGTAWTNLNFPGWGPREQFGLITCTRDACNGYTHFLVGGLTRTLGSRTVWPDVWGSSDNGVNWTRIKNIINLPPRYGFALSVDAVDVNNKAYIVGGAGPDDVVYSDVWVSDATSSFQQWTSLSLAGTPGPVYSALLFISTSRTLHVLGGALPEGGSLVYNQHWQSTWGGRMWCKPTDTNPPFINGNVPVSQTAAVVNYGDAYFSCGRKPNGTPSNAAYAFTSETLPCNTNQAQWIYNNSYTAPYTSVCGHTAVYMKDVLYLFGGSFNCTDVTVLDQVWNYTRQAGWTPVPHDGLVFTSRYKHGAVYFQNSECAYIWGGVNATGAIQNDLIRFCGATFERVTMPTAYQPDYDFGYTLAGSRIYMLGGAVHPNRTYSSAFPFTTWTQSVPIPDAYTGSSPRVAVSDSALWYLGGRPENYPLRMLLTDFNTGTGSWSQIGSIPVTFGDRGAYVVGTLAGLNASANVPAFDVDNPDTAMLIAGGDISASFSSFIGQAYSTGTPNWKATDPYPLSVPYCTRCFVEGADTDVLVYSAFAVTSNSNSLVVTGGLLDSGATTNLFMTYSSNACLSDPCQCGGTCIPGPEVVCQCLPGFSGNACQIQPDVCASNPCLNGGTCTNSCGAYSCTCSPGYIGDRCEVDSCIYVTCQNGGTCVHDNTGVMCNCPWPYTGSTCTAVYSSSSTAEPAPILSSSTGSAAASNSSSSTGGGLSPVSSSTASDTPSSSSAGQTGPAPTNSSSSSSSSTGVALSSTAVPVPPASNSSSSSSSSTGGSSSSSSSSSSTGTTAMPVLPTLQVESQTAISTFSDTFTAATSVVYTGALVVVVLIL